MNKMRSKTAEKLFEGHPIHVAKSAGLSPKAKTKVTPKLLEWADLIYAFESWQARMLKRRTKVKPVVCLYIPDEFGFMDSDLIQTLRWRLNSKLDKGGG
jgi:protein-tyrosine phosphatase